MRSSYGKRKRREPENQDTGRWLITYADMITLLVAFFVLLVGISVKDRARMRKVLGSMAGSFGVSAGDFPSPDASGGGAGDKRWYTDAIADEPIDSDAIREIAAGSNLGPETMVQTESDKVKIQMNQTVLFDLSSGDINPNARDFLAALSDRLRRSRDDVEIRGHADRFESIDNPYWPGNSWELSAKRAMIIYDFLRSHGVDARRMSVHGFGDTYPLVDAAEKPELRSGNARVDLVLGRSRIVPSQAQGAGRKIKKSTQFEEINYKNFLFRLFPAGENRRREDASKMEHSGE